VARSLGVGTSVRARTTLNATTAAVVVSAKNAATPHKKTFSGERRGRGGRPPDPDERRPFGGRPRPPLPAPPVGPPDRRPPRDRGAAPPDSCGRNRRPGVLGFLGGTDRGSLDRRCPLELELERELERERDAERGRLEERARVPRCVGLLLVMSSPGRGREPAPARA